MALKLDASATLPSSHVKAPRAPTLYRAFRSASCSSSGSSPVVEFEVGLVRGRGVDFPLFRPREGAIGASGAGGFRDWCIVFGAMMASWTKDATSGITKVEGARDVLSEGVD